MRILRLALIVVAALPLGACFMSAEQIAADNAVRDDAACRDSGLKRGTAAYAKCRQDMTTRRNMADMTARIGMQNDMWAMQQMSNQQMMRMTH